MSDASSPKRCAIYTRKSTEEGLEQDFNSLDAQREACAAYIVSQRHEGWVAVPGIYDDGGFTGGNMDRPGLKALLAEVSAGNVDIIVVYKVDRLTRSLSDFARIVDVLDAKGASFVSVTQSFNTTTSMGRLTLNVLLSFAQFEREVTGERIRDKIAASKAKGMWMGGPIPLGYDLQDRKLVINEKEAQLVRHMFNRYLELGSGRLLVAELDAQGIRSKPRVNRHGREYGDQRISRGALYAILQNRLYVGQVVHQQRCYPGQHDAIIDLDLFDAVQNQLETARVERRTQVNAKEASLLAGRLFDAAGRSMSPSHASKNGKRYRYYVSQSDGSAASGQPVWRVNAPDIEQRVTNLIVDLIEQARIRVMEAGHLTGAQTEQLDESVSDACAMLHGLPDGRQRGLVATLISRVHLSETYLQLEADLSSIDPALANDRAISDSVPISAVRSGKQLKLVIPSDPTPEASRKDPALIKLIVQSVSLRTAFIAHHQATTFERLAQSLGFSREHAADLLRVSYLAPDIISAIIGGRHPDKLTRTSLIKTPRLPLAWAEQRAMLGFA